MAAPVPQFVVDAFVTERPFSGNPAAVCLLDSWPADALLQDIAREHNLSETAFVVSEPDAEEKANEGLWRLRWFTPAEEVELCGHATLAAAFVLFQQAHDLRSCGFLTRSGRLEVWRDPGSSDVLRMDFPALEINSAEPPAALREALGSEMTEFYAGMDYVAVLRSPEAVGAFQPPLERIRQAGRRGLIITAGAYPESGLDFVSRFFAPQHGIDEDPVTGSAHCALAPYWSGVTGKKELKAMQLSARAGRLNCTVLDGRVELAGGARLFSSGEIDAGIL